MGIDASKVQSLIYTRIPYSVQYGVLLEIDRLILLSARMLEFIPGARGQRGCRSGTILIILYLCISIQEVENSPCGADAEDFLMESPIFGTIAFTGVYGVFCICIYGVELVTL